MHHFRCDIFCSSRQWIYRRNLNMLRKQLDPDCGQCTVSVGLDRLLEVKGKLRCSMPFSSECEINVASRFCSNTKIYKLPIFVMILCVNIEAYKVIKEAMIRNRYNQVPHRPRTPRGKVTKHNKTPHTREPRGQAFPGRWPQGCIEQTRKYGKHET